MSKNDVNIGASPDDGNGDPLRTAFNKLNNTLAEVYSGLGDGSDLSLSLTSNGILNVTTKVTSTATVTDDDATTLTTKGYVDSQFNTADTLPEVLTRGNTTGGSDIAVSANDDITFTDSSEAIFGTDADLQIYHDGSNAKIVNSTGDLNISDGNVNVSGGKLDVVNTTGELALQVTGGTTDASGNFATEIRIRGNKANNATARNVGGVKWYNNEVGATDPDDDEIASIIVDQTAGGSGEAQIEFNVLHCDSMNERMRIFSNGQIKFNAYENTDLTGTPTYILGTTVTGDVVKVLGSDIPLDYLPLAGGTLTGALTGTSGTFSDTIAFNSLKDTEENITVTKFVDEADGIINNDNDTTVPTSAAIVDYTTTTRQDSYKVIGLAMDYMSRVHNDGGVVEGMEQVMKNTEKLILA
tara:strand:- start:1029 stop:2264 length:1236 start_codon:yes stop_codon:yes gene_type:complete